MTETIDIFRDVLIVWSGWLIAILLLVAWAFECARRMDSDDAAANAYRQLDAELSRRPIYDGLRDQFDQEAA